jgi:hypothetical protein
MLQLGRSRHALADRFAPGPIQTFGPMLAPAATSPSTTALGWMPGLGAGGGFSHCATRA